MKLQFGLLYRDEQVANREDLATLLGDYAAWHAETSGQFYDGPLVMGYRGDKITWEEDTETQPFTLGPYTLTFDGRLDNRVDVAAKIGIAADRNLSDPLLILRAYVKYGDPLMSELIGEFALVLWHSDTRTLTFARSVEGSRSLYFVLNENRILWSSDLAHLLRVSAVDRTVDRDYLVDFLVSDPPSTSTPFLAARAIRPGTVCRFVDNRFVYATQLWTPADISPSKDKPDSEYERLLRDQITDAVRVRLRTKRPVFAELSGGLDSSTIVLIGDEILRDEHRDPDDLMTLSTVYDQSSTCDERYFISLVEHKRGLPTIYVQEHEQNITCALTNITFTGLPNAFDTTPGRFPCFADHMRLRDARVLLTGVGGDHIFRSTAYPESLVADLLCGGHLAQAHRCGKAWSRFSGVPYFSLVMMQALRLALSLTCPRFLYQS